MNMFLDIDLSRRSFVRQPLRQHYYQDYLGGRGLGARLLYDLLPPGVDPLGPENVVLILTGPLTGSIVPGSGKYAVVTKSPASGGFVDSYASGQIAVEIKQAGYDGLIIRGRADKPCYLVITDERVEFRDAAGLWGKDTFETEEALRQELCDNETGFLCIGPAGENLVKYATINSDFYRQAARGGVGAVVGSKNLKAIAVKGSKDIPCYDMEALLAQMQKVARRIGESKVAQARMAFGTPLTFDMTSAAGMLPTRNYSSGVYPPGYDHLNSVAVQKATLKSRACYGCMIGCSKITKAIDGTYQGNIIEGPEYETLALLGSNLDIPRLDIVNQANILCDRLGLDTISTGNVIGFIMECREKGLIHGELLGGADLCFGDGEAVLRIIEDIAWRRGAGDLLAEGVRCLAERIGQGSDRFGMQIKGLEFAAYDPRIGYGTALSYAVNPRGACHRRAWPPAVEVLGKEAPYEVAGKAESVKRLYDENSVYHSLLVCDFPAKWIPLEVADFAQLLNLVTGGAVTEADLWSVADRVETTIRLFNLREGLGRADDRLPRRAFEEGMADGPAKAKVINEADFSQLLDNYYRQRGWSLPNGQPEANELTRLRITTERGDLYAPGC